MKTDHLKKILTEHPPVKGDVAICTYRRKMFDEDDHHLEDLQRLVDDEFPHLADRVLVTDRQIEIGGMSLEDLRKVKIAVDRSVEELQKGELEHA